MSTSKLQELSSRLVNKYFGDYIVKENYRPEWMISSNGKRLELDLYVEKLSFAIEIQGNQHYKYVPFFHSSPREFEEKQKDDKEKKILCRRKGVTLYEISTQQELFDLIGKLKNSGVPSNRFDKKFMGIILGNGSRKSKIMGAATYMYRHFIDTGKFYEKENLVYHSFYTDNKADIDTELNKMMKDEKTKNRLSNSKW